MPIRRILKTALLSLGLLASTLLTAEQAEAVCYKCVRGLGSSPDFPYCAYAERAGSGCRIVCGSFGLGRCTCDTLYGPCLPDVSPLGLRPW
jgi:hypothetical protein